MEDLPPQKPSSRHRLLLFSACAALACSGCIYFEQERLVIVHAPERNEARALLLYDSFHVIGGQQADLEDAREQLRAMFVDRRAFYLGHPLFYLELPPDRLKPPEESPRFSKRSVTATFLGFSLFSVEVQPERSLRGKETHFHGPGRAGAELWRQNLWLPNHHVS
jgi:hypothetical protein